MGPAGTHGEDKIAPARAARTAHPSDLSSLERQCGARPAAAETPEETGTAHDATTPNQKERQHRNRRLENRGTTALRVGDALQMSGDIAGRHVVSRHPPALEGCERRRKPGRSARFQGHEDRAAFGPRGRGRGGDPGRRHGTDFRLDGRPPHRSRAGAAGLLLTGS
jgi:hypothetical protein